MFPETVVTHWDRACGGDTDVSPPIHQTTTFLAKDDEAFSHMAATPRHDRYYTRDGNPTVTRVETVVAALEGGESALLTASGMGAISTAVLALVTKGDHVIAQRNHYMGTTQLLDRMLPRFGIDVTLVDNTESRAIEEAFRANTRLVIVETPANPLLTLTDLSEVVRLARMHQAVTLCDSTIATPINQRPLSLGVDLVVHSATKFLGGHHDVMAGVVVGTRELLERIWNSHVVLGSVADPHAAWLLLRGLRTLPLRIERQNQTALRVATYLNEHRGVLRVHYPGLSCHPQHELAARQMPGGFGGLLSFELKGGYEAGGAFINRMKLPLRAVSFGGFESLATQPAAMWLGSLGPEHAERAGIAPGVIRLSVGLEHPEDLLIDLDRAIA